MQYVHKIYRILRSLRLLLNPKTWGPFVQTAEATNFDHSFRVSWSQGGEDLALLSLFGGLSTGTYLDIGAHHPSKFSVTRHLYRRGWNGINVDANKMLIKAFEENRSRDINLCLAIGDKSFYELTIFTDTAISTVNAEWKEKFVFEGNEIDRIEIIPGRKLRDLYDEYFSMSSVDVLTVDAEGADFEIIRSMEFDSLPTNRFPKFLMLETPPMVRVALDSPAVKLAIDVGYEPVMVLSMATILRAPNY
jgi:FkbM family methyltransferase